MGLIDLALLFYMILLLVRLFIPFSGEVFINPLYQAIVQATEPVLVPLRRLIQPTRRGFDWSPIVAVILVIFLRGALVSLATGLPISVGLQSSFERLIGFLITVLALLFLAALFVSMDSPFAYNQVGHMVTTITNPLLRPIRLLLGRRYHGTDPAPVIGIVCLGIIDGLLRYYLIEMPVAFQQGLAGTIIGCIGALVNTLLFFLIVVIILRAIISWFSPDPMNPLVQTLIFLSNPVLVPIQRLMPGGGLGIDFSPMIAILILSLLRSILGRLL